MEITFLGHSSFRLKSKDITLVTDPFDPKIVGLKYEDTKADVVTISHDHTDHNYLNGVSGPVARGGVFVINRPGEYEIGGVEVRALSTFHDAKEGKERGSNLIMVMRIDDIFIVHLGDLGHVLSEKRVEDIGLVDVLLVPVGGGVTLDAKRASQVITQLEPSIVVPMHYGVPELSTEMPKLVGVDDFIKEMGAEAGEKSKKLKVTRDSLPENMQVVIMEV